MGKLSESCKLERPFKKMTNKKVEVIDLLDSSDEIEAAHDDLDDLITMLSPTGTRNTVKGVCTAVLSSAYVTLI